MGGNHSSGYLCPEGMEGEKNQVGEHGKRFSFQAVVIRDELLDFLRVWAPLESQPRANLWEMSAG